jgi:hypothetical protein
MCIRGERHWDARWLELPIAQADQLIPLVREIGFRLYPFRRDRVFRRSTTTAFTVSMRWRKTSR